MTAVSDCVSVPPGVGVGVETEPGRPGMEVGVGPGRPGVGPGRPGVAIGVGHGRPGMGVGVGPGRRLPERQPAQRLSWPPRR